MKSSVRIALWASPILTLVLLGGAAALTAGWSGPGASDVLPLEWAGPAPTEHVADGGLQIAKRSQP